MAVKILWWSVLCASISTISAIIGLLVLAKDSTKEHRWAKIWFILHMITAGLAVSQYSKVVKWQRTAQLKKYHENFLWLSRVLGVPIMSAHVAEATLLLADASQVLAGVGIAVFAIGSVGLIQRELITNVANGLVIAVMTVLCCLHRAAVGLLWALFLSLSLLVGVHGPPFALCRDVSVPRIDLTHILLALTNLIFVSCTPGLNILFRWN